MTRITRIVFSALIIILTQLGYGQGCEKCNTEELLEFSENIENLNHEIVRKFICTFDSACISHIEFSEWSNELLFKLIERDINLLNQVLHELDFHYVKLISKELETPVVDVDFIKVYDQIKNAHGSKDIIVAEKKAIKKAAEKEGIILE